MVFSLFSRLLLRRRRLRKPPSLPPPTTRPFSTAPLPETPASPTKPPNLSARLSFVFDQIDAIDRGRSAKDAALQRIRAWRQNQPPPPPPVYHPGDAARVSADQGNDEDRGDLFKKEVELVHPWPEWIELMERLAQQNYFDSRRFDEDRIAENAAIDLSEIKDQTGFDFSRDWTTVRTACMNFGRDRFDIIRSLSRNDLQILVGHGCPSMDPKVVFSAKLLRKYVDLDEGDVCSSCSLRNTCGRGYILTRKEDEARTLDVMRILLTFGFDHVNGSVENKPLMKMKSVKAVVRKLLHEVVKLGAIPIDPNLPPPVIKKPPLKVKQPPPPPKKRVGRDDVEMKEGDWLCHKCDFMNFAKNIVCLQCDAKRPNRQLLPGEWECPKCNFLNYRRNMACFLCEHQRPPDEYMENQMQARQPGPQMRVQRAAKTTDVSNAWNFDFDDNESDGADVAAFEFADTPRRGEDSSSDITPHGVIARGLEDDIDDSYKTPRTRVGRYFSEPDVRKSNEHSSRTGFDDFDDEEDDDVDSYELDTSNNNLGQEVHRKNFSEVEQTSDSEDFDDDHSTNSNWDTKNYLSGSEDDNPENHPHLKSSRGADSWQKPDSRDHSHPHRRIPIGSDDGIDVNFDSDDELDDGFKSKQKKPRQRSLSDLNHVPFLGSESDDDDHLHARGKKMRGTNDDSGRRVNNSRKLDQPGSARRREFRSDDRSSDRRNSFGNSADLSSRGSHRYERGSHGEHRYERGSHGEWRENDRFQRFDSLDEDESNPRQQRKTSQSHNRSRITRGNERGSRNDGYGGGRRDGGFRQNNNDGYGGGRRDGGFRQNNNDGYGGGRRGGGFRQNNNDGYGGGRRDGGFRQNNRFIDRSRSFDDGDDNSRPHRRVIER